MNFRPIARALAVLSAFVLFALAAGSASASPGALRVMIAESQCDSALPATVLRNSILSQPGAAAVDFFDTSAGTPSVDAMAAYDVVFAMGDCSWSNGVTFGDNLASYQDQGGVVIAATFSWQSGSSFGGRWMTDGYTPWVNGAPSSFADFTLGNHDATHPLMQGVNNFQAYFKDSMTLASGATELAKWSDGESGIAVKGRAVGINAYIGGNYLPDHPVSGDFGRLVVNAGNVLGRHAVTVTKSGSGKGTVASIPAGVDCGAVCSAIFANGVAATLTATPAKGSTFAGWSGGCTGLAACSPASLGNVAVGAVFATVKFGKLKLNKRNGTATLSVKVDAAGKLKVSGKGIKTTTVKSKRAGTVKLKITPKGSLKAKLASSGKGSVKAKVSFTPTGGKAASKTKTLRLKQN